MGAVDRWERIAQGLFWTGWLFVAFTAYGVYSGDDWRGIVMTLVPGAIVFALWYMARARADYLAAGTTMPLPAKLIAVSVVLAGVAFVVHTVRMAPQLQIVTREDRAIDNPRRLEDMLKDASKHVEIGEKEVTFANGEKGTIKTLVRKPPAPEPECAEVVSVADPREGHEGERVEVCKRWAEPPK
jgi:septum formation topological specificity factor MinE